MSIRKTYSEMLEYDEFEDRFDYLALNGVLFHKTFGKTRYFNQEFYHSASWRDVRDYVISRDNGCDLAHPDWEIHDAITVHHITPMSPQDFEDFNPLILDPENLVCVSHSTHNALHYGLKDMLPIMPPERQPGDTLLW